MAEDFQPCVYILASGRHGTLYIGVTSDLMHRLYQHRERVFGGFTARYDVSSLVYFEQFATMDLAIQREKRLKEWKRDWKITLIEAANPDWHDLAVTLGLPPLPMVKKPYRTARR